MRQNFFLPLLFLFASSGVGIIAPYYFDSKSDIVRYGALGIALVALVWGAVIAKSISTTRQSMGGAAGKGVAIGEASGATGGDGGAATRGVGGRGGDGFAIGKGARARGGRGGKSGP